MTYTAMSAKNDGDTPNATDWGHIVDNFAELGGAGTGGTATIGGTGWAIGNGAAEFSYRQLTKWQLGRFYFTLGSTSTDGTGGLEFTLPNSVTTIAEPQAVTVAVWDDTAGVWLAAAGGCAASATKIVTSVTSTSPVGGGLTTSDIIVVSYQLELA